MNTPTKFAHGIDIAVRWSGALLVAAFAAMVVYVVGARYLFSSTPSWAEELPRLLLVWVTFLGTVSAFVRGTHFRAGLLQLMLPPGLIRNCIRLLAVAASAVFLAVLGITGWQLSQLTWSHQTTALSLPVGVFYMALPVACTLSLVGLLLEGWRK